MRIPASGADHSLCEPSKTGWYRSLLEPPYWTASVLPALVGTTLPIWLQPQNYTFRFTGALEFLIAAISLHAFFFLLQAAFEQKPVRSWSNSTLLAAAMACMAAALLLGLHLMRFVPNLTFIVYGFAVFFAGVLYVVPPLCFSRRPGGEIVVSMTLGLLPVLGAYLVQTGDLTRLVYLASIPIYTATLLWVWTDQMLFRQEDSRVHRDTLVMAIGQKISGQIVVPGLSVLFCGSLLTAVLTASISPLSLSALLLIIPLWRVTANSWSGWDDIKQIHKARTSAFVVHSSLCAILVVSSLLTALN